MTNMIFNLGMPVVLGAAVLLLGQLMACIFAKKALLRWLPFSATLLLMAGSFLGYALSGWTNWGFSVLIAVLLCILLIQGIMLLVFRIAKKLFSLYRKNT